MIIRLNHVSKGYNNKSVLKNLHLEIKQGDFTFLLGKSGVGKTTLLKLLYMNIFPDKGEVVINLNKNSVYASSRISSRQVQILRQRIGIIFQDFKLFNDRNVFENIAFPLRLQHYTNHLVKSKVHESLSKYRLTHKMNALPNTLSGGEQQRVTIARATITNPYLIIADEPTGNLDPHNTLNVLEIFKKLHAHGTTIIMATHQEHLVKSLPYNHMRLDNGSVSHKNF